MMRRSAAGDLRPLRCNWIPYFVPAPALRVCLELTEFRVRDIGLEGQSFREPRGARCRLCLSMRLQVTNSANQVSRLTHELSLECTGYTMASIGCTSERLKTLDTVSLIFFMECRTRAMVFCRIILCISSLRDAIRRRGWCENKNS